LFEKIGAPTCPTYGFRITNDAPTEATRKVVQELEGKRGYILAPVTFSQKVGFRPMYF
jgi:excinuclease UvrABC ATPase subunit